MYVMWVMFVMYAMHVMYVMYVMFFLSPCTSCRAVTALKLGALAPDDTRAKLYVAVQPSKCYDFEHQTLDNLYGLIYCELIHLIWKSIAV